MKHRLSLCLISLVLAVSHITGQTKADDIVGIWLTAGKEPAKIQVYRSGDNYFGKIVWLKNPVENGKPRVDSQNPEIAKQNQPIIGLIILKGFKFDGSDQWQGGAIYDPESGKTYSCYLSLKDRYTLKVRGYVGISWLGRTETWTRQDAASQSAEETKEQSNKRPPR